MSLLLLFNSQDHARVTQEALEAAHAGGQTHLTQALLEAAHAADAARLTQALLEAAYSPPPTASRLTQALLEAAHTPPLTASRLTQFVLEAAYADPTVARPGPLLPAACWTPDRLLAYLGAPFTAAAGSTVGLLFSAVARELTGCSRVERLQGDPVRSAGNFRVVTRFGPITDVTGVFAVDGATPPNVIGTYPVLSWADRTITVDGAESPTAGQRLVADYSYQQEGLEARVREALAELNVQTADGTWLEALASFFGVARLMDVETDAQLSSRVIDRVRQSRNTETAILAAVRRLTGGTPYILSWFDAGHGNGFVFNYVPGTPWTGGATDGHLIWGKNARFINGNSAIGGTCVFEVWIPGGSPYTDAQVLAVVNSYKAAGTKAIIRHYS